MKEIVALSIKDLRLLLRDKAGFVFTFIFPLVYAVFLGAIFAGVGGQSSRKLQLAVVDEDQTQESAEFIDALKRVSEVEVTVTSHDEAVQSVRRGKRMAYITLAEGFGTKRDGMFWGEPPEVRVGIDPSRQAEAAMLQGVLIKSAFDRMQDMFRRPEVMAGRVDRWLGNVRASKDIDPRWRGALELFLPALQSFVQSAPQDNDAPKVAEGGTETDESKASSSLFEGGWQPIAIKTEPVTRRTRVRISSYAWSFPQGIIWGVMACAFSFGLSLVVERNSGTLVRLVMAPIDRWHILAGKAGACFLTTVCMMSVLLLLAAVAFNVRPHSIGLLAVAVVSISCAFVGIMMLLSVMGKTEQSVSGIGWAVLLVMAMIGGGMVPRIFMPGWMSTLSHVSPVKWSIHAMEGALWRGFSAGEMVFPCAVLIIVGIACFGIGVRLFRWQGSS